MEAHRPVLEDTAGGLLQSVPDLAEHNYYFVLINDNRCNFAIPYALISDYLHYTFQNEIQFLQDRMVFKSPDQQLYTFCNFGHPIDDEGSNSLGLFPTIRFWIRPTRLVMRLTR